jgi:hypothetical protein
MFFDSRYLGIYFQAELPELAVAHEADGARPLILRVAAALHQGFPIEVGQEVTGLDIKLSSR